MSLGPLQPRAFCDLESMRTATRVAWAMSRRCNNGLHTCCAGLREWCAGPWGCSTSMDPKDLVSRYDSRRGLLLSQLGPCQPDAR